MLNISNILDVNKEIMLLNVIKHNLWNRGDIIDLYKEKLQYTFEYKNVDYNMNRTEIQEYFINFIKSLENKKEFDKFINRLKYYEINKISDQKLFKAHEIDNHFDNRNDLQYFILNKVLPEVINLKM